MVSKTIMRRRPRVVLDTNVVVSSLLFEAGRLAWLRAAWQSGNIVPLASRETVTELLRVLAYPKFRLMEAERDELMAEFLPHAETVAVPPRTIEVPACRDPHDRPFLVLAEVAKADALVTGDADLLTLAPVFRRPILSPEAFRQEVRRRWGTCEGNP